MKAHSCAWAGVITTRGPLGVTQFKSAVKILMGLPPFGRALALGSRGTLVFSAAGGGAAARAELSKAAATPAETAPAFFRNVRRLR